jgi:hypothetical protein
MIPNVSLATTPNTNTHKHQGVKKNAHMQANVSMSASSYLQEEEAAPAAAVVGWLEESFSESSPSPSLC